MQFNMGEAWDEARAMVARNKEIFLILAGVFFILPAMVLTLMYPQPEPQPGVEPKQMLELFRAYWIKAMPAYFVLGLVQAVGTLAILKLCSDPARPTVGEALKVGGQGLLTYIGSQLLVGLGIGLLGGIPLALAGLSGSVPVVVLVVIALLVALAVVLVRLSLVTPVIAAEGERNPVTALRRSWDLTRGNGLAIFGFFALLAVVFAIALMVVMLAVGVILAIVAGGDSAKTIAAVISAALSAGFSLFFIAALAAVHRQLSGGSAPGLGATFD